MELPSGPLLIVSPHLDDAVFSCSALLGRGEPAEVLVAFAGFPNPPHNGEAEWIGRAMFDWLRRSQGGTIALPAGAGARDQWWRRGREDRPAQDPDHVFTRDTGLSVLSGISGVRLWLYEEFPLMAGGRADGAVKKLCTSLGLNAGPFAFTVNRRDKALRAGVFRSRRAELGHDVGPASLPVTERYWALSAR